MTAPLLITGAVQSDDICTNGQDKLCWFVYTATVLAALAILLSGCERGPSEEDMASCPVRGGGPPITHREVADCAVERAAREQQQ